MKTLLLSLFLFGTQLAFGQRTDTIFFNNKWEKTDKLNKYYFRVIQSDTAKNIHFVRDFYSNNQMQMQGYYSSLNPDVRNGEFIWWFENGKKQREAIFKDNLMIKTSDWDLNGNLKNKEELVQTVTYEDGEPIYELKSIEVAPVFPGGIPALSNYISNNVKYPPDAINEGISGTVLVRFIINIKGKIIGW